MGILDFFHKKTSKTPSTSSESTQTMPKVSVEGSQVRKSGGSKQKTTFAQWYAVALAKIRSRQAVLSDIRSRYKSLKSSQTLLMVGHAVDELVQFFDAAPEGYVNEDLGELVEEELSRWAMLQKQFEHLDRERKRLFSAKELEMSASAIHSFEREIVIVKAHIEQLCDELRTLLAVQVSRLGKAKKVHVGKVA